jgi:hypothetical protein
MVAIAAAPQPVTSIELNGGSAERPAYLPRQRSRLHQPEACSPGHQKAERADVDASLNPAAGFALATNLFVAIGFLWVASVMSQAFGPVQRAWLNKSLDNSNRATLFSVHGHADALGQIVGGPIIGVVASGVSIRAALVSSAALLSLALPLVMRALGQAPHSPEVFKVAEPVARQ